MTAEFEESRRLALDCLRLIETPGTPAEDRAQGQDNMSDVLHKLMGNITRVTAARDGLEQVSGFESELSALSLPFDVIFLHAADRSADFINIYHCITNT